MEAAAALIGLGGADLSLRDNSGFTPLHVAVDKNHLALAKTLMDRGAAVDITTNVSGVAAALQLLCPCCRTCLAAALRAAWD
jgi:ankyrin repeat protein